MDERYERMLNQVAALSDDAIQAEYANSRRDNRWLFDVVASRINRACITVAKRRGLVLRCDAAIASEEG